MLDLVRGQASERKLRLFACACGGSVRHLLEHERSRQALRLARRCADGEVAGPELEAVRRAAKAAAGEDERRVSLAPSMPFFATSVERFTAVAAMEAARAACDCVWLPGRHDGLEFAQKAAGHARDALFYEGVAAAGGCGQTALVYLWESDHPALDRAQAEAVREVFGNPFRPARLEPAWRTPDVYQLARGIYEEGAFERLPILADALEEAGCYDQAILDHCRGPGHHLRGCWLVDLLTRRE
jgi:hypothetical protein